MEASLVVPGPLDVVGTPSRFHLWDEDPVNHLADPDADGLGVRAADQPELCPSSAGLGSSARDLDSSAGLPNDEVREELIAVCGFGRWGAEWFVARSLGRGDVCPAGDLAVRRAAAGGGG